MATLSGSNAPSKAIPQSVEYLTEEESTVCESELDTIGWIEWEDVLQCDEIQVDLSRFLERFDQKMAHDMTQQDAELEKRESVKTQIEHRELEKIKFEQTGLWTTKIGK